MIQELEKEFIGTGDVKGFMFKQIASNEKGYLYEVTYDGPTHYEVVKRLVVPICLDFSKKVFSTTDFKEIYPDSKKFGISGWTFRGLDAAKQGLKKLLEPEETK